MSASVMYRGAATWVADRVASGGISLMENDLVSTVRIDYLLNERRI